MSGCADVKGLKNELEEVLRTIGDITQRVHQQARHGEAVGRAKVLVQRVCRAIANDVASRCADVEIWSSDGVRFTANKAALSSASPVLRATFVNGTVEERTSELRMEFPGEALRVVLPMVHSPSVVQIDDNISLASLLDACELADYWKLYPALDQLVARAVKSSSKKGDARDWFQALNMAGQRCEILDTTEPSFKCWHSLVEAAGTTLARSEPANLMSADCLKDLDIKAVCQILSRVDKHTFKLPDVKLGGLAECKKVSGRSAEQAHVDPFAVSRRKMRLKAHMQGRVSEASMDGMKVTAKLRRKVSVNVVAATEGDAEMSSVLGSATITILRGSIHVRSMRTSQERRMPKHGHVSWPCSPDLDPSTYAAWMAQAEFTVSREQRCFELFNRWMLDGQIVTEPLSVLDSLAFLRACVSRIDPQQAAPEEIKAALEARGLPFDEGSNAHQVVRLTDALGEEMLKCDAVRPIYESFARLIAADFESLRSGKMAELCQLDVGALSLVLKCDDVLWVKSEDTLLDTVLSWASTSGRSIETLEKLLPLVRFPLCSLAATSPNLKAFMQRSTVLKQLVNEGVELQLKQPNDRGSFAFKKHALVEGVLDDSIVPRDKRRRLCKDDKVPHVTVEQLVESIYNT